MEINSHSNYEFSKQNNGQAEAAGTIAKAAPELFKRVDDNSAETAGTIASAAETAGTIASAGSSSVGSFSAIG